MLQAIKIVRLYDLEFTGDWFPFRQTSSDDAYDSTPVVVCKERLHQFLQSLYSLLCPLRPFRQIPVQSAFFVPSGYVYTNLIICQGHLASGFFSSGFSAGFSFSFASSAFFFCFFCSARSIDVYHKRWSTLSNWSTPSSLMLFSVLKSLRSSGSPVIVIVPPCRSMTVILN